MFFDISLLFCSEALSGLRFSRAESSETRRAYPRQRRSAECACCAARRIGQSHFAITSHRFRARIPTSRAFSTTRAHDFSFTFQRATQREHKLPKECAHRTSNFHRTSWSELNLSDPLLPSVNFMHG